MFQSTNGKLLAVFNNNSSMAVNLVTIQVNDILQNLWLYVQEIVNLKKIIFYHTPELMSCKTYYWLNLTKYLNDETMEPFYF